MTISGRVSVNELPNFDVINKCIDENGRLLEVIRLWGRGRKGFIDEKNHKSD